MRSEEEMDRRLWEYLDGESQEKEKISIDQLISADSAWARRLQELKNVHAGLHRLDPPELPAGFSEKLMQRIRTEQRSAANRSPGFSKVPAAIGLVFLLCVVYTLLTASAGPGESMWPSGAPSVQAILHLPGTMYLILCVNVLLVLVFVDRMAASRYGKHTHAG